MDYELMKKLRDSGFPKSSYEGEVCVEKWHYESGHPFGECYLPDLTDLIFSCGEDFWSLHLDSPDKNGFKWTAKGGTDENDDCMFYLIGKTPEEAVANLWLSIKASPTGDRG